MNLFNGSIVGILNEYFSKNEVYVESVLLASYGFKVQLVNFDVRCEERVFAMLAGKR